MRKPASATVTVKQDESAPVEVEVLATAIIKLDEGMQRVVTSGLRYETLVTLLHDTTKVSKSNIRYVLNTLTQMRKLYTTK